MRVSETVTKGSNFRNRRPGSKFRILLVLQKCRFLTHVEIKKRQFWSTSVQLVFDAPNGRRVRIFAGARDGYEGFEFLASQHQAQKGTSETVTRVRIFGTKDQTHNSGLLGCSKKGRFLTHVENKNAGSSLSLSLSPRIPS